MTLVNAAENKTEYPQIKELYIGSFPSEERAPFRMLCKSAERGRADFWSLNEDGAWAGMAYVLCHEDLAYLFYLAVDGSQRGKGLGHKAIAALLEQYAGCRFFLALEQLDESAENYPERLRRHQFYRSCGLVELPYHIKEASVVYDIMGSGGTVEPPEYAALIDRYMGPLRRHLIGMRILK